jgi:collagen type III alpha
MPPGLNGLDPATQPRSGGFGPPPDNSFPGSTSRATVTPPTPEDTTSWPGVEADQGRFDSFKPEAEPAPAKPETPHVRLLPILIAVVVAAGLILGIVFGIVYLVAGGKDQSLSVIQGECVKRDGEAAVKAECSDATSFQVVSIVADKAECADPQQPYVVNKTSDGKNQVLCLKPQG